MLKSCLGTWILFNALAAPEQWMRDARLRWVHCRLDVLRVRGLDVKIVSWSMDSIQCAQRARRTLNAAQP